MLDLSHKKLDVWKKSLELVSNVYKLTHSFPREEQFGLTSQIRRASVSNISNIAEGFARSSEIETKRFLEIARSSLVEVDTQIEISKTLGYISENNIKELKENSNHIFAMLTNLIKKFSGLTK
ncbi:MAG: four helix bundle protein [Ignavibacterium album]|jgi:four helix bundle protein|uniref:four helix bundle protein n=1 Tax=Ignavibacterium album TaxID=591197 RepID=UPI0026ED7852|nr:four helix bundle protein [Ignavibacterium album]MCX8104896.1 four helix bundle protein [Ignavibacterium album]